MNKHKKFLFFRTAASSAIMVPASQIYAIDSEADDTITFYSYDEQGDSGTEVDIVMTINTGGKHEAIYEAVVNAINSSNGGMIVIGDDITGDFIHSDITAVGAFTNVTSL